MRLNHRSRITRGVVTLVSVALLAAGCGSGDDGNGDSADSTVGITATSIKLGTHMPLTGVAAPGYSNIPVGAKAYFDYVNAAGGVNGRKIDYLVRDDTYNPTKTGEVVDQLTLKDKVFGIVQGLGTPTHSAVVERLNEDNVPDLFVSSGALAWNQPKKYPNTFGWQPNYVVEGKILGQYIKEHFPNAKVGLYLQNDDLGRDGSAGLKRIIGKQVVAESFYTSGNTDVAPVIGKLQAAKADLVVGFNVPAYTALARLVSQALSFKPQWMFSSVAFDAQLVGGLLGNFSKGKVGAAQASALLDGTIVTQYLNGVDTPSDPWVQLWQKVWKAHGDGKPLTNFHIYGMSEAYTIVQTLLAAGKDLTRQSVIEAIEDKGGSFQGPGLAPFGYSDKSHSGMRGVGLAQMKDGKRVDIVPVATTDDADGPITPVGTAHAAPPASGIPAAS